MMELIGILAGIYLPFVVLIAFVVFIERDKGAK